MFKALAILLVSFPVVAGAEDSLPIELCRSTAERVQIDIPAGTEFTHGQSGADTFYTVTLQAPVSIHSYADCVHTSANTSYSKTNAGDELHLAPDKNPDLKIIGSVFVPKAQTNRRQDDWKQSKPDPRAIIGGGR